ncbi:LacI family DNA-binding transcriptional regulator [Geofilum sp. OHC36d9]|uniref:LacI family DNA-binding transcriptional regulator n=1 Tax=Geofilum sp. OHC36d9 TaxID=3458413 RepID=UPI004033CD0C
MKRTTIIDIANALGITPSTVSRALSGSPRVNEETRKRIEQKAEELHYQPNMVASSLRKGRNDTIGVLVPRINRHFFSHVVGAIEEVLNPAGFSLLICQSHERLVKEVQCIDVLLKNRVAGIIMSHSVETIRFDHIIKAVNEKVPVVQFDRVSKMVPGPRVVNENFNGGYMAVKHLIRSNYRRIAHFTGSLRVNVYDERFKGYCYALEEAGIPFDESLVFEGTITSETSYAIAFALIKSQQVDAFFCAGDYSAMGVLQAARECGISIPGRLGLVGFANEPFADLVSPRLSTVEQNAYDLGHKAATALLQVIQQDSSIVNDEETVPVRLLVRESSSRNSEVKME